MTNENQINTDDLQSLDQRHYLHPFTDYKQLSAKGSRIITRADGVYVWDADGNKILDGMAGLWCVNVGYGQQALVEAAYKQMQEMPYYNSFFQTSHPPAIELSRLLSEVSPDGFEHTFFTGSGSEANDTVIRLVRRYWQLMGQPEKQTIIGRKNAYHGSTIGAASLGGMVDMHNQGVPPIPGVAHIEQPYYFGLGGGLSLEEFGVQQARLLEQKIQELGRDKVAAFIGEPIQGAGGVIIPPDSYWPEIQRICDENDILLIADEVITGFGRLGEWFGSTFYNIRPDLIPFAKGVTSGYLPLGGVLVGDRIAGVITEQGGEFAHGFTYSGHPVACAVAIANIRMLRDEGIIDTVKNEMAPYFAQQWATLGEHPIVGEARCKGLMGAIEIVADKTSLERFPKDLAAGALCRDFCFESGLVMRSVGDSMIVAPPLVINQQQVDELIDKARRALDLTADALATAGG
jgi:putrescine aminotransferase